MDQSFSSLFVVGPPAAGKTTIASLAAARIGLIFRTIDEWTPRGRPMTDDQVQLALASFFSSAAPSGQILEFSYHDYQRLLADNTYPTFSAAKKIIVTSSLETCMARNHLRSSQVRQDYIERSWRSTQLLCKVTSTASGNDTIVIDTTSTSIDEGVEAVIAFITRETGDRGYEGNEPTI